MNENSAENLLLRAQAQTMPAILTCLVRDCRARFVDAAKLLDLQDERFSHLRLPNADDPIEIARLSGLYETIMLRYLREIHDAQIALLENADEFETRHWTQYAYWALIPKLVNHDAMARDVMRAVGAHPCASWQSASNALVDAAINMTMPPVPKPAQKWPT